jgi:hypothetical protein
MFSMVGGACLLGLGIAFFALAPQVSDWEKEMTQRYPQTRVTGWSGTPKGVLAWRCVGIMCAVLGAIVAFDR